MANPLTRWLRGEDARPIATSDSPRIEQKFNPADATVPWPQVQSLVYTLSRNGYDDMTGDGNSAVFACLVAAALASIEPPLSTWRKLPDRKRELMDTNPVQDFLDEMNPFLDTIEILFWKEYARRLDGNAYLLKSRSAGSISDTRSPVVELWPISPHLMHPYTEKGSPNFIDYYKWDRGDGKWEAVPVENVIHFKLGIDPRDPRLGLSPCKKLVREVASDSEATRFAEQLLANFGIPGLVVEVPSEAEMTREDRLEMKYGIQNAFGGENRGGVGILSDGATMKQFGFTPEQLNLQALHNIPESRICAVLGVPAAVAGLNVGLEQTAQYASMRVIQESFTERTLIPFWHADEAKWNRWLKPDFSTDKKLLIAYDLSEVRALQEDQDALFARLDVAVQHGWVLPDEARSQVGLPPLPDGSGMKTAAEKATEALAAQQAAAPAEEPAGNLPPGGKRRSLKAPFDTFADDVQAAVDGGVDQFQRDIDRYMDEQQRRVRRALLSGG